MKSIIALICILSQLIGGMGVAPSRPADEATATAVNNGVVLVLEPDTPGVFPREEMDAVRKILSSRLSAEGYSVDDYDVTVTPDERFRVWVAEADDPEALIEALTKRGRLEFRYRYYDNDENGDPKYALAMAGTAENISGAYVGYGPVESGGNIEYYVELRFTPQGQASFKEATSNAVAKSYNGESIANQIVIALDEDIVSAPSVDEVIDSDTCIIHGSFYADSANNLAAVVNSGALPFGLKPDEDWEDGEMTLVLEPDVEDMSAVTDEDFNEAVRLIKLNIAQIEGVNESWRAEVEGRRVRFTFDSSVKAAQWLPVLTQRGKAEFCYVYDTPDGSAEYAAAFECTGENVRAAGTEIGLDGEVRLRLDFTPEGTAALRTATENIVAGSFNGRTVKNALAVVMDGKVLSEPVVFEVIDRGDLIINGGFDEDTAIGLSRIIDRGELPFGFRLVAE